MVRRNSIEASTRSSMAEFDDSALFRSSEFQANSDQADLKFLSGEYYRLVPQTSKLSAKTDSMEAKLVEIQKTLSQLCNQLGIHPIEADSSQHVPPVTNFSDPYVHDDVNRLSLDNRKNLSHKIEMPKFDGSNAYEWLSTVERFFRVGRYSDCDKLDLVSLSLEGDVLKWFNWQLIRREFRSWEDFRRRLFRKFGASPEQSPRNRLFALKQTGTVSAYVTEFEELSSQVVGLDELHLEQIFYKGLKTEMREVLKLKEPEGLENQKNAVLRMETSSFCQLFNENPSRPGGTQQTFTSRPVTTYTQPKPLLLQNGENIGAGQVTTTPATRPNAAGVQPQQKIIEDVSENVADILEEKKLIPQCQVPISSLEPSLSFSSESLDVSQAWQSEIVSNNRVHSQADVGCVKHKNNAHHVFDELFRMLHDPGGKKVEHSDDIFDTEVDLDKVQRTQIDPVAESMITVSDNQKKSRCLKASMFNFKRKKKRIKRWFNTLSCRESWRKHKHENLQIVSGLLGFNVGDFRCHKEYDLARMGNWSQVRVEYSLLQGDLFCKNTLPRKPATSSSMLPLYVYQMGVSDIQDNDTEMVADPVSLQLILDDLKSHMRHKRKSKHLQAVVGLQNNLSYALDVVNKSVIECTNDRVIATALERQAVLEQIMKGVRSVLLHNPFPMISRVGILVLLAQRVFQKLAAPLLKVLKSWMFKYKPQLEPTVCTFGGQTDHVIFQAVIGEHQQVQSSDPPTMLPEDLWIPAAILEVKFDKFSRREFLFQRQGRDVLENSWVYSMAFVQSYHAFKLEDKLVFGEGSIDTIKQSYYRRKKKLSGQQVLTDGESDVAATKVK